MTEENVSMQRTQDTHDESMIDESLEETFPASDPPSPIEPGSLIGMRYSNAAASRARLASVLVVCLVAAAVWLLRRRDR